MHIYKKTIERITIIGPQDESRGAFQYCGSHDFRIIRVGPKRTSINNYDIDTFELVAEREIPDTIAVI